MTVFLLVLLFLILAVAIIDWVPLLDTWQSRIRIGQFTDFGHWMRKVTLTASDWLRRTPTVKVTDNTRVIIIDMMRGNYKKSAIQSWQQGALVLGLTAYVNTDPDESAARRIAGFTASAIDASGNWKVPLTEVDQVLLAYAIAKTPGFDAVKNQPAIEAAYLFIRDLTGVDGTIMYRRHSPAYRLVDTIGFICPFLVRYGVSNNKEEAVQLALKQIREFNKYAMFGEAFIPCHSYDVGSSLPVGLFGWGRGMGWYALGLMDSWLELPENHPDKNELTQMIVKFSKTVLRFQHDNGSWSWIVMSREKQSDSSATAVLSWFLAAAAAIPEIRAVCIPAKDKGINYLKSVTRRGGAIDFSQGDTKGVGVYSQKFDILPFTQGFCLRALYANPK